MEVGGPEHGARNDNSVKSTPCKMGERGWSLRWEKMQVLGRSGTANKTWLDICGIDDNVIGMLALLAEEPVRSLSTLADSQQLLVCGKGTLVADERREK